MQRKPELRLGYKGAKEVKNHAWLKYYPWNEIKNKTFTGPFQPEKRDNFDKRYCNSIDKIGIDTQSRYEEYHLSQRYDKIFENYTYYPILDTQPNDEKYEILEKTKRHIQSKSNSNSRLNYSLSKQRQSNVFKNGNSNSNTKILINKPLKSLHLLETDDYLNIRKKTPNRTPIAGTKLNKKATSQSTYNFRNYPVTKSVNLSNIEHFISNNNYFSSSNKTISPTYIDKSTDKGIPGSNAINKINMKLNDPINKRNNSKSACSNYINQSILMENNKTDNKSKPKHTLHKSSSTYGYISIKPNKKTQNDNDTSITVKVIEPSTKTKDKTKRYNNIPHISKPSGQFRIQSSHQNQNSVQIINQANILFNNYKMNSTSCNSTGSSNVSNNTNNINKIKS